MKKVLIIILSLAGMESGYAQKQIATTEQLWVGYINQTRLSDKWDVVADIHLRTKDKFTKGFYQSVFRAGAAYHVAENASLAAGYAYFDYYPGDNHPNVAQSEHRIWEQVQWNTNYSKIHLQQRIRLEERYRRKIKSDGELDNGYSFNYRARYSLNFLYPLGKHPYAVKSIALIAHEEVMVNYGKEIVYNTFDQNRFLLGFNYYIAANNSMQLGYMNVLQQQSSGNKYKNIHAIRLYYYHTLDLRKTIHPHHES